MMRSTRRFPDWAYGDTSGKIVSGIAHFSDNEMFQWSQAVNWMEGDEKRREEILEERKYTKERQKKPTER